MKKILILGGGFNPPHKGHLSIGLNSLAIMKLREDFEEVWYMPYYSDPFNSKELVSSQHRIKMCLNLIKDYKTAKLCTYEIDNKISGDTYKTMTDLKLKYPNYDFAYIIGADQAEKIKYWDNYKKLLNEVRFIIIKRPGYSNNFCDELLLKNNVLIRPNLSIKISSTYIRTLLKTGLHGKELKEIIPKNVYKYIVKHNLYVNTDIKNKE